MNVAERAGGKLPEHVVIWGFEFAMAPQLCFERRAGFCVRFAFALANA